MSSVTPEPKARERHTPCGTQLPEEQQHRLGKGLEIVVPVDLVVISHGNFPKHLGGEIIVKKKNIFCHPKKENPPYVDLELTQVPFPPTRAFPQCLTLHLFTEMCRVLCQPLGTGWSQARSPFEEFLPWGGDSEVSRGAAPPDES